MTASSLRASPTRRDRTREAPRPAQRGDRRVEALAALALALVYLATMSGHLHSMDGLFMYRQAHALVFDHSIRFQVPVWIWNPDPVWNSKYGLWLSLLYAPGLLLAGRWLRDSVPVSLTRPENLAEFYWTELYLDPLYTVAAAPVHVLVTAVAAYLVARFIRELGFSRRAALWGLGFYGLGSAAIVYARGDFSQPLEGLCWVAALRAAVRYRKSGARGALLACAGALGYAVLTRPIEGSLLFAAVALLLIPPGVTSRLRDTDWRPLAAVTAGYLLGVGITLLVNWARFGSPFTTGYHPLEGWRMPNLERLAGVLVSPARGVLWEFPALILVPAGLRLLHRRGHKQLALALAGLAVAQLLNVATWHMWWGGWNWGLRLFVPALPLLATLAGIGVAALGGRARRWLPWLLLAAGMLWAAPGVVTDLFGGYGAMANGTAEAFTWRAYPPVGAWAYFDRWRA